MCTNHYEPSDPALTQYEPEPMGEEVLQLEQQLAQMMRGTGRVQGQEDLERPVLVDVEMLAAGPVRPCPCRLHVVPCLCACVCVRAP